MVRIAIVVVLVAAVGLSLRQSPWSSTEFDGGKPERVESLEVVHEDGSASNLIWLSFGDAGGGWFVLDTGAAIGVVDTRFADRLQFERGRSVRANGVPAELRTAPPVSVGRLVVHDPVFVSLDLTSLLTVEGLGFEPGDVVGVIGYPIFKNATVRIEYRDGEDAVFLYDPEGFVLPEGEGWMAVDFEDRAPILHASIAGAGGRFKLDTGKTFAASVSPRFLADNGIETGPLRRETNVRLEGPVEESAAEVAYIELMGQRIDGPTIGIRSGDTDRPLDGVIGRELLQHFTITLDYRGNRTSLKLHE